MFQGEEGGDVIALVNTQGIVSAKVLGEPPSDCYVTAKNIVKRDRAKKQYTDTGRVANDIAGEPATSLMAMFYGPVGKGSETGYVFHADMDLQQPYPKAIVINLDCSY